MYPYLSSFLLSFHIDNTVWSSYWWYPISSYMLNVWSFLSAPKLQEYTITFSYKSLSNPSLLSTFLLQLTKKLFQSHKIFDQFFVLWIWFLDNLGILWYLVILRVVSYIDKETNTEISLHKFKLSYSHSIFIVPIKFL